MKTGILTTKTIASEDIKDTKSIMGMSSKGMEIAQYFLRDKIYSDKILAVIREYVCNAWDEHSKYNIDKPVDIKIVKHDTQWIWSVRDYALGLNDYDIRNVFGMYFESTKSNENNSIGGFGIGGKAGFSYTDTFYVNSYHNGVKTSYVCTLGAGSKGVPVGEIYEISKEPTTEQGIEISLEIKSYSDSDAFMEKTRKFVKFFTPNAKVVYTERDNTYKPEFPIIVHTAGDYIFNQYAEAPFYKGESTYFIRMGGVVYPHKAKFTSRSFVNKVVVDVPIGELSIPISRESIESTPLNDKVFADIEKHLDKILEDEKSSLTVPKFGSLACGLESRSKTYQGTWFTHSFSNCFPTTTAHLLHTARIKNSVDGSSEAVSNVNNKRHIIYVFPDIKSINNWHKRLINALKSVQGNDYNGYAYIRKAAYTALMSSLDNTIDISDCSFVDIKTLKLPKLEKNVIDNNSYLVYETYGYKHHYTAEELDNHVMTKHFKGEELEDDWYLEAEDMGIINHRTVGKVSDFGTRSNFWTVNSQRMIDALKELGWLTPDSQEYIDMKKKFDEKYRMERIVAQAKNNLTEIYFGVTVKGKIVKMIEKSPKKIERFDKVKNALLKEDSTRGRILKTLREYSRHITREDLRKILMMKD